MRKTGACAAVTVALLFLADPAHAVAPTNDAFASATVIASLPFSEETTDTTDATIETDEPVMNSCVTGDPPPEGVNDSVAKTVWYKFVPAADVNLSADTFGSVSTDEAYDTVIVLWKGTTLTGLEEVACSDESGPDFGSHSRVGFPLIAANTYYLQIGSWTGEDGDEPPVVIPPDTGFLHVHAEMRTFLPGAIRPGPGGVLDWFLAKPELAGVVNFEFGASADQAVVGTTTGDGISKPVFLDGNVWFFNFWFDAAPELGFPHGRATDFALLGDYEGDTLASPGLVRGNTWFLIDSTDGTLVTFNHGRSTDYPVVGDWDGNGSETPGLIRGNVWFVSNQVPPTAVTSFAFAKSTDFPVVGDWNGDGSMEPGAVRGNVWYLANAVPPTSIFDSFAFAGTNDLPIPGDWDGAVTGLGVGGASSASSTKGGKKAAGPFRLAS